MAIGFNGRAIKDLISEVSSIKVYPTLIPENADLPACCYSMIDCSPDRDCTGSITSKTISIKLTISAESLLELENIANEISILDNSSNKDFHRVYIVNHSIEDRLINHYSQRAFINIDLYPIGI